VIWTGANDGPFHVTRDGGRTWSKITPKDQPPGCRVQNIDPSPHRRGSAYYAVLCYLLGDFRPYLWRTDDYGRTWTRLTTGRNGIPADTPITDLKVHRKYLVLSTQGRSFWILDNTTPLHQLRNETVRGAHLPSASATRPRRCWPFVWDSSATMSLPR
jgi:photosystem II stability/assembly factor-like uncharacterized protein